MSGFLPVPGELYRGPRGPLVFLTLLAIGTIVPGLIHSLLPDGGAEVIAGLELGSSRGLVVGLFGWAGATQIVWGLAMLAVALRYKSLAPLFLGLVLLERAMLVARWWLLQRPADGHHPPEHYTSLALLPLLVVFLVLSLRPTTRDALAARR